VSVSLFLLHDHSFQWIWTKFALQPLYNIQMIKLGFTQRGMSAVGASTITPVLLHVSLSQENHLYKQLLCKGKLATVKNKTAKLFLY